MQTDDGDVPPSAYIESGEPDSVLTEIAWVTEILCHIAPAGTWVIVNDPLTRVKIFNTPLWGGHNSFRKL